MESVVDEWKAFLSRCIASRIPPDVFAAAVAQLHAKSPLPGRKLAALVLLPRAAGIDPRSIAILEQLLALKKVDASDVLTVTFLHSKDRRPINTGDEKAPKDAQWSNPPELEEIIFHRLHKAFASEERPVNNTEGLRTLIVVTRWMQVMVTSHTSDTMIQAMAGIQQPHQQSINAREGLAMLVIGVIENPRILAILSNPKGKDVRKNFVQSLSSFIPFLHNNSAGSQTSLSLANRLEMSQKQHDFFEKLPNVNGERNESTGLEVAALQLDAVMELPQVNTRPGLYVFLNALLVARPLTDDFTIISHLHSRYKVGYPLGIPQGSDLQQLEPQNMATDLITAAFDILANAMYRNEQSETLFYLKSFLINKVPILLTQLSGSIFPMTVEMCITQALSHVDPHAFPSFSQGFDDIMGSNNSLSDVRQDFLNACALHGLIAAGTVERLLGEAPMQGPPAKRYERKELLNQCKTNFDKISLYIDELENVDGNAGAIVAAVTDFIAHLCETQTTMYLKQLSCLIFRKPQAMDVMLQFTSPPSILRPLCQFLDDWHYDSDQGEHQPVYDEFGAILVCIMTFMYRYDLTYHDIGIGHDSFVAKLMQRGHHGMLPDELTEEQGKHLGNWLKGLYDSDKEGLSNEVFASCRPQEFYLTVPTLFRQTVVACSTGVLSFETVKGGLEYLGETFLLPSLIGGLTWMASYALLQTHNDLDAMIRIFNEVILSSPTSGDAQAMHSTIIAIVSSRLEKCFRTLQRREPNRTTLEPFIQAIKAHSHYERTAYATLKELDQWTNVPHSTLNTSLRHTVQQLSQWASTASLQPNPPSYTHRQIYASLKMLGATRTLRAIVEEVKNQTDAGNGAAALDIGISIICAPMVEDSPVSVDWVASQIVAPAPQRTRMNLREILKQEFDCAANLVATDPLTAETIVRLHRRVEAHFASLSETGLQAPPINIPSVHIGDMQSQTISDDLNRAIDDAAAASIVEDISNMDNKALQRSMDELTASEGLDLSSIGMGNGDSGTGDMGTDLGNLPDLDLGGGGDDDWGLDFDNM
ncbi:mediator of RNA polymerase II transcription subunit 5 [Pyrenophora tritici-repentis]|uniref:Mediator of RNA polymerase II transcription subunit 5 n=1 Tax=Pyrenophora tritici-repentis TaxID=45151 RepID=A0A2W1I145_9PLEO|nr:Mediator of RNA polymerase II transcription subunit 5 [Pyrenophora tritici-repentis]KAF7447975.1 Mediator of RNA polymerase II transcription protein [Pyrenophora tritici-repentis]KAF7571679.1 mediator RNA polymerase II transcription subunit 5 [Pyrenophora tritici-repentis]KAI1542891.1 mediator of RNA polymerase II transcription subunit 5 [Pyrenophora tritici-repentis]KAI1553943.1 mediator of RNA polymerase II transcription subunit 5 [Pyrenophora tritici-repentis]